MIRFLLKLGFTFSFLFALSIALIRAQPYDDSELRAFLTPPEGCPAPCFMGIRPGVTTMEEALAILEGHEWVEADLYFYPHSIEWSWSGLQPSFVDGRSRGAVNITSDNIVQNVLVRTNVQVGYMYLVLGTPDRIHSTGALDPINVSAFYLYHYIGIYTSIRSCPVTRTKFWDATLTVLFSAWLDRISPITNLYHACTHR